MKAKEYFEKYNEDIAADDKEASSKAIAELLNDLRLECGELIKSRKAKSLSAILSCHKEQNAKFNALRKLFVKKYGEPVLVMDGYKKIIISISKDEVPELEELWNYRGI